MEIHLSNGRGTLLYGGKTYVVQPSVLTTEVYSTYNGELVHKLHVTLLEVPQREILWEDSYETP